MSMVRVRAVNGDVFEIEATLLRMLYQIDNLRLPIRTNQAMDDLVYYVRQCDMIVRLLPRRPIKQEGRIVRRRIDVAALDARATGVIPGRGITAQGQMEVFKRAFVRNRDFTSLTDIGKAAVALSMWDLAGACFEQMLDEGVSNQDACDLLWDAE